MTLQTDVAAAAASFLAKVTELVTNANYLGAIVTGPDTGPTSTVNVGTATLKTIARILAEAIGTLDPSSAGDWSSVTTYPKSRLARRNNKIYISMLAGNLNHDPASETNGPNWFLFVDPQTAFDVVPGAISFTGDITPAQVTAQADDYAPPSFSTCSVMRVSTDTTRHFTGLAAGADGRRITWENIGPGDQVLDDESASSSAANRFGFPAVTLKPRYCVELQYDAVASRWRLVAGLPDAALQAVDPRFSHSYFR